jgi:hypothetical protein
MLALATSSASMLAAQDVTPGDFALSLEDSAPDWAIRLEKPTGCLASISRSYMHRVPIYLQASVAEQGDTALRLQADLMAQDVADEYRKLLGAAGNDVPTEDTIFVWYTVPTELVVIAHRNGDATARARRSRGDSSATALLIHAFDAARAHGTARIIWPDRLAADSLLIRLTLWPAYVGSQPNEIVQGESGMKFATFFLSEPVRTPAVPLPDERPPRYPSANLFDRFEGYVVMQFVVDSAGRTDPNTIRDLWPAGKPRLLGPARSAYDEFLRSVRIWDTNLRFDPARLDSCAIAEQVRQPLMFKLRDRR